MSAATRPEWPAVVGSRDSMATTEAETKPSKSRLISSWSSAFSIAAGRLAAEREQQLLVLGGRRRRRAC